MALKTPSAADFTAKWQRRTKAATTDYVEGINRVTDSPMEKAVSQQDVMRTNLNASIDDGRWARGLQRVTLPEWKSKATNVGAGRIGPGVDAATAKMQAFAQVLLPHIEQGLNSLEATPRGDFNTNLQRMVDWANHMHSLRDTR